LNDALETLALAEHSGGGRVLQHGDFSKELAAWNEEISTGNPFASVVAQDIMEPFPALLSRDTEQPELVDTLRRANIPVRPCVDREGRLAGYLTDSQNTADNFIGDSSDEFYSSPETLETISHDATFPEIYEALSTHDCGALVVTAGNRPLGYVTREGFLSMIDPIHAESFANKGDTTDMLSYLVVPSAVGGSDAEASIGA
jgi:predicted transcriptional regulator